MHVPVRDLDIFLTMSQVEIMCKLSFVLHIQNEACLKLQLGTQISARTHAYTHRTCI